MKYECSLIEDLLPLYKDGICSGVSKTVVEEHIAECPHCREMLNDLNDTEIDEAILKEKDNVLGSQSKFFKRKSAIAGSIIAAIFAIPILVCLIVDLASGNGLGWFFIVLAAMMIPSSLFVVPFLVPKNRMFATMSSFTASVILLLGVCCVYTGGNWFFVAASGVLFGLTVLFSPFIACRRPVKDYLKNFKGLTVMTADTITFFLMILCIGLAVKEAGFFSTALSISIPLIVMAWIIFVIIRYLPFNGLVKAGICIMALCLFAYFGTYLILYLTIWRRGGVIVTSGINLSIPSMIGGLILGVIFIVIGIISGTKKGGKNE